MIPVFLAALLPFSVQAAITITVSPDETGTLFSVTQTAPNPPLALDPSTVGTIPFIALAAGSFAQDLDSIGVTATFGASLGTLSEINGAGSSPLVGFQFFKDPMVAGYQPALVLETPIELESGSTYRFMIAPGSTSGIPLDFDNFVPGIYVDTNPIFGETTTVVVPEPATLVLGMLTPILLLRRRRN